MAEQNNDSQDKKTKYENLLVDAYSESATEEKPWADVEGESVGPDGQPAGDEAENKDESGAEGEESSKEQEESSTSKKDDEGESDDDDLIKDGDSKGVKKRINKAIRRQREAERQAAELKAKLEETESDRDQWRQAVLKKDGHVGEKADNGEPEDKDSGDDPKPKADDFDEHDDYIEALASWRYRQDAKKEREAQNKKTAEEREAEIAQELDAKHDKGREKYDDYDEVALSRAVPYSEAMADAVLESDVAHELAYYLGSNLEEADRISKLPPLAAAKEIGKIEAKLSGSGREKQTKKTKQRSDAPPPFEPVHGSGSGDKNPSEMTMKEYIKFRHGGGGG